MSTVSGKEAVFTENAVHASPDHAPSPAAGSAPGSAPGSVPGPAMAAGGHAAGGPIPARRAVSAPRAWLRLLGSEIGMTFRRPRNLAMLAVLTVIPVLIGIALRMFAGTGGGGGPAIFEQITGNGLFLTFAALSLLVQLLLPVSVAVVAGDSIAGEAGIGTLRYLLVAPVGRTRLLAVKYAGVVVFCLAAVTAVALSALLTGLVLFPAGPITLLSGGTIPFLDGLLRIGVVVLYVTAGMAALAAVALAMSTLTEVSVGAIAATVVVVIVAQVLGAVPQLSAIQPYLLTEWWNGFDGVLRDPVATGDMGQGLLVFAAYAAVFCSIAWARFTGKDITA
ncbi:ABC transporter permease [Streptosporangium sp. NBC_01755]|uniref:ABC transporter permease n=1 Tax=Streptosporangium sp. NBC_01755 TaxID=2975949 RepID=UPI002DDBA815|nr:ABC transporter permease [Streptosporangium sp. NBC_01755]WSD00401.1 ABC transporter permease [Streptosporangium sp. NBC_01755]